MWPFSEIRRLRAELDRERESRHSAENQLVLIVASIQREEDLADVRRRMELHAKHLDLVEGRIDKVAEKVTLLTGTTKDCKRKLTVKRAKR